MHLTPHLKETPMISADFLHIVKHTETNIRYTFAYLISQDTSLIQSIISNHSVIEEKCQLLLETYREEYPYFEIDMKSEDENPMKKDMNALLNIKLLQQIILLNNATVNIIKLVSLSYEIYKAQQNTLIDICNTLSSMLTSATDAFIQQDAEIARKGMTLNKALTSSYAVLAQATGTPPPAPFLAISGSIRTIQELITNNYSLTEL